MDKEKFEPGAWPKADDAPGSTCFAVSYSNDSAPDHRAHHPDQWAVGNCSDNKSVVCQVAPAAMCDESIIRVHSSVRATRLNASSMELRCAADSMTFDDGNFRNISIRCDECGADSAHAHRKCTEVYCTFVVAPNSSIDVGGGETSPLNAGSNGKVLFGRTFTVTCRPGYVLKATATNRATFTCNGFDGNGNQNVTGPNGEADNQRCEATQCNVEVMANTIVVPNDGGPSLREGNHSMALGTTFDISCLPGFRRLDGNKTAITCNGLGTDGKSNFSGASAFPECVEITQPIYGCEESSRNSNLTGCEKAIDGRHSCNDTSDDCGGGGDGDVCATCFVSGEATNNGGHRLSVDMSWNQRVVAVEIFGSNIFRQECTSGLQVSVGNVSLDSSGNAFCWATNETFETFETSLNRSCQDGGLDGRYVVVTKETSYPELVVCEVTIYVLVNEPKCVSGNRSSQTRVEFGVGDALDESCAFGSVFNVTGKRNVTRTCVSFDGQSPEWKPEMSECRPVECGSPPEVANSTGSDNGSHIVGANATYRCLPGHATAAGEHAFHATCSLQGEEKAVWEGTTDHCLPLLCNSSDLSGQNGSAASRLYSRGENAEVCCHDGYKVALPVPICSFSNHSDYELRWQPDKFRCELMQCGQPPDGISSAVRAGPTDFGAVATYDCHPGYATPPGASAFNLSCAYNDTTATVSWTDDLQNCTAVEESVCNGSRLPDIDHASHASHASHAAPADVGIGSRVAYSCHGTHHLDNGNVVTEVTCGPDLLWHRNDTAACVENECRLADLPEVANSSVENGGNATKSVACWRGHRLENGARAVRVACDVADGKWRTPGWFDDLGNKHCQVVTCDLAALSALASGPLPPDAANSWGSELNVSCEYGYVFPNQLSLSTVLCDHSGEWTSLDGSENWKCSLPRQCDPPPLLPGTEQISFGTGVGDVVEYVCLRIGARFPGGGTWRSSVCLASGSWSSLPEACVVDECPPIGSTPDDAVTVHVQSKTVGAETAISCSAGGRLPDGLTHRKSICGAGLSWTPTPTDLRCLPDVCPPMPYVDNSKIVETPEALRVNSSFSLQCDNGYFFGDGTSFGTWNVCTPDLDWDYSLTCKASSCSKLDNITKHSTLNSSLASFGEVVVQTCDVGYAMTAGRKSRTLICLASGGWNDSTTSCTPIVCKNFSYIDDAKTVASGENSFLSHRNVTCKDGLRHRTGRTEMMSVCSGNATWTNLPMNCKPDRCAPLEFDPSKAIILGHLEHDNNTEITISCVVGFQLESLQTIQQTVKCDGIKWMDVVPCKPIQCSNLSVPFGYVNRSEISYFYNGTVTLTCDEGYELGNGELSQEMRCGERRQWMGAAEPVCLPRPCHEIPIKSTAASETRLGVYQEQILFTCLPGFWYSPGIFQMRITCGKAQTWNPLPQDCRPMSCSPLTGLRRSSISNLSRWIGTQVNVSCQSGSILANTNQTSMISLCSDRAIWIPAVPPCRPTEPDKPFVAQPVEAPAAKSVGITICVLLSFAGFFLLVLDAPLLMKHLRGNV